jgi:hypothetical protein
VAMLCSVVLLSTYAFALQQWSGYGVMLALLIFHLKPLPALQNKLNLTHSADASS